MEFKDYTSVREIPLVGRKEILRKFHAAVKDSLSTPHVFYITASGGWGKTRLVDTVLSKFNVNDNGEWASTRILSASRLVDLYHTYTHSEVGLVDDIVDVFSGEKQKYFENYIAQRSELDRVKHDLSQVLRTVIQQRVKMMDTFITDFNNNAEKFEKIVLAFDTVENLTYESDQVQKALGLDNEPIGVAGWLVKGFLPKIRNAVVFIAGRPETPQLENELVKLNNSGLIKFDHIALETFGEDETLEYFESVLALARIENPQIAERLLKIPRDTKLVIHYLSGGEPFFLSLFVDYLATASELHPLLETPLSEIKNKFESNKNRLEFEKDQFKSVILQEFLGIQRPFDDVIRTLAWTEKGMGAELLAWVIKRDRPTEEEIEQAKKYIDQLRDRDFRLSFVKIRDVDKLVFLQDEMYKLMRPLHQEERMRNNAQQTYELISRFYEEKINELAKVVNNHDKATQKIFSSGSWKELTEVNKKEFLSEQQKLRVARARMQSYQVEHVYYCLQADYIKGIQAYYRAVEGAFQSNDAELWLFLRDELLRFAKNRASEENKNDKDVLNYINGDIGVRWIKSNIANGQYEKAFEQIERFRSTCSNLLVEGSFADLSLSIWESWALTYDGKEYKKAIKILEGVLEVLKNGLSDQLESEFDEWRSNLLTAYAQDILGYMYRSQGNYEKAIEFYQKNKRLWKRLEIRSELANTLNNLSWALTEVGDFQSAIDYCEDGLNLRRQLGYRYPIALSMNTLGLIETRSGHPERARFRCEQALAIFRDLEQPRGVGLACTALAEALRRMTNVTDLLTIDKSLENLSLAEQYAGEAVGIFLDTVKERLRLVEAYIELGCDYRETSRWTNIRNEDPSGIVEKGEKAFDLAVMYSETEFAYRGVDALVNKAWMYYYVDEFERAGKVIDSVLGMIQPQYLFTNKRPPIHGEEQVPWYWVQLGKAYLLLGIISFKRYEQAHSLGDNEEIAKELKNLGKYWTLSLAYDAQYGKDFRDVKSGRKTMYNCLYNRNPQEWIWVKEGIESTKKEYVKAEEFELFEEYIGKQF